MNFKYNTFKVVLIISICMIFLLIFFNFTGCCVSKDSILDFMKGVIGDAGSLTDKDTSEVEKKDSISETAITMPIKFKIFIEKKIPYYYKFLINQKLGDIIPKIGEYNYEFVDNETQADFIITIENYYSGGEKQNLYKSIFYVPVTSFYSMVEDIAWQDFIDFWKGSISGLKDIEGNEIQTKIVVSEGVLGVLEKMLGECRAASLEVVKNYEILPIIEGERVAVDPQKQKKDENQQEQVKQEREENQDKENGMAAISVIPFDDLRPEFKVLSLDGISVLDKNLEDSGYPLAFEIKVQSKNNEITKDIKDAVEDVFDDESFSNRFPDDIVTIIMTGVTALTRQIAARMDEHGILYPAEKIADVLWDADITHISNEVSFVEDCYAAKPNTLGQLYLR
jgi:hypothetical protein